MLVRFILISPLASSTPSLDFLFEFYTEEIPSSYQINGIQYLRENLPIILDDGKLSYQHFEVNGTHRRIVILILALSENQNFWKEKKKGPPRKFCFTPDGEKTPQLLGFAKKVGVKPEEVRFEKKSGEEYSFVEQSLGGGDSLQILGEKLPSLFLDIPFEKKMRWGNKNISYARPILQYFSFYKNKVHTFDNSSTFWHDVPQKSLIILDPITREKASISSIHHYFELLKEKRIVLNAKNRLSLLQKNLLKKAKEVNLTAVINDSLLQEVNFLVERPKVIVGEFPADFLELPEIIITTEMQEHQKYFPLKNKNGNISNKFLIVANTHSDTETSLNNIRLGNQKVLTSRLNDGAFFFTEDRKKSLESYATHLKDVTHQEKIGSMFDKKERLKKLAKTLLECSSVSLNHNENYLKACDLLKADLTTKLVYEFDSLQGKIGSIYAALDGQEPEVCLAIEEHYLPRFQDDEYPSSTLGILLSLCDKFDNLICSFLLGREPSASHDSLGVRRQTIYIIEIIIQNKIELPMFTFLQIALHHYTQIVQKQKGSSEELCLKIWNFFRARFSSIFEKTGFDKKMIQASLFTNDDDIFLLYSKMSALKAVKENNSFIDLMSAFTRMNNILEDYKHKSHSIGEKVDESIFLQEEEKSLYKFSQNLKSLLTSIHSLKNYEEVFLILANSKPMVDSFFDHVMVMHENESIKMNRLALLSFTILPIKELFNLNLLK